MSLFGSYCDWNSLIIAWKSLICHFAFRINLSLISKPHIWIFHCTWRLCVIFSWFFYHFAVESLSKAALDVITSSSWSSTTTLIAVSPCGSALALFSFWCARIGKLATCGKHWPRDQNQTFWKLTRNDGSTQMRFNFDRQKRWKNLDYNTFRNKNEWWRSDTNRFWTKKVCF